MNDWVQFFHEKLMPIAERANHTILGPWIDEAGTEFIWIRVYDSRDDARAKDDRFYGSSEWQALAAEATALLAKSEVTTMTSAEDASRDPGP